MALSMKAERGLVSHEEFELLARTHHPALADLTPDALTETGRRLRDLRSKDRTLARTIRRGIKGTAETRGGSHPGDVSRPARRKQAFGNALKRVNNEISRRRTNQARDVMRSSLRRALEMKDAQPRHHPGSDETGHDGMRPIESDRTRTTVPPAQIGSVSQENRNAQAARDNRG